MRERKSQVGSDAPGGKTKQTKILGGFMPPLHSYLRKKYGPGCGFDAVTNVFNMLEQHILGNWAVEDGMQISRTFMSRETGLSVYQLDKALKYLTDSKMIHVQKVCEVKPNGSRVWQESIYRLHPDKYGIDILWLESTSQKPTFQIIPGGKMVTTNVIQIGKGSLKVPHESNEGSLKTTLNSNDPCIKKAHESNEGSLKVPHEVIDLKPEEPLPEPVSASDKSIKESLRISQEGVVEREIDKQDWEEVRNYLVEKNPQDGSKIDMIYRELQLSGVDDLGHAIGCLPALMFSSYLALKKSRQNPYEKRPKVTIEEPIDEVASAKVREVMMNSFFKRTP